MTDRWGPKHVQLNLSADKNLLIKTTLCILLDYIYVLHSVIFQLESSHRDKNESSISSRTSWRLDEDKNVDVKPKDMR